MNFIMVRKDGWFRAGVFLFVLVIVLRAVSYSFSEAREDGNRDYLVARHMIEYDEMPSAGPHNNFDERIGNSPLYYYLLAPMVWVADSPESLGYGNLILFAASAALVFFASRMIFGPAAAFWSLATFLLSPFADTQTSYVWQPWAMQPLLLASIYLFLRCHLHKEPWTLPAALCFFLIAGSLHFSAFGLSPAVAFVAWSLGKRLKLSLTGWAGTLGPPLVLAGSILLPWLSLGHLFIAPFRPGPPVGQAFWANVNAALISIPDIFLILGALCGGLLWRYLSSDKPEIEQEAAWAIFGGMIQFLFAIAFVATGPISLHYLTPLWTLVVLAAGPLIAQSRLVAWIAGALGLSALLMFLARTSIEQARLPYLPARAVTEHVLRSGILGSFGIEAYTGQHRYRQLEAAYWRMLEERTGKRLVRLDSQDVRSYVPLGHEDTIFVVCKGSGREDCRKAFTAAHPEYAIRETIHEDLSVTVWLARKIISPAL